MGILFAVIALIGWGVGDLFIQKSTRKFGDWNAIFFITVFASIVLFPFIYKDLVPVFSSGYNTALLLIASLILTVAAIAMFEAYKRGKLSVIESIGTIELPIAVILAFFILRESLQAWQILTVFVLFLSIFLVSTEHFHHFKNAHLEKGIWLAIAGGVFMGGADFIFGMGSRQIGPLMINWFTSLFLAVIALIFLIYSGDIRQIGGVFIKNKKLIFPLIIMDVGAWIAISYGTLYAPIGVVYGISEAYVALAAVLGLVINKEKLKTHQWVGVLFAVLSAITLAYFS